MKRKPGELIETFGDFWLGMAGAVGKGLSTFTERRRELKEKKQDSDFYKQAAEAIVSTVTEAQAVASSAKHQLD